MKQVLGDFLENTIVILENVVKSSEMDKENQELMLNFLKILKKDTVKTNYTNPKFRYEIVFRPGAVESIKKVKGWKTDSEMAKELDLTRAYVSLLKHGKASCTQTVITRVAACLGNTGGSWWIHFEIIPVGFYKSGDPIYNQDKYAGRQPYERYSPTAEFRRLDNNEVETKKS